MNLYEKIIELENANKPFVVVSVINTNGHVPGKVGFKMIVEADGKSTGTVGGGAIEQEAVNESIVRLKMGEHLTKEYILSDKADKSTGNVIPMSCSGKVELFYEVHGNNPTVYIYGGGHVGNSLLHFLSQLPFYTVLIDNRKEFANRDKNPNASEIVLQDYAEYVNSFDPVADSYHVIMTHGHEYDYLIMKGLIERGIKAKYIGVIASKVKSKSLIDKLKKEIGDNNDLTMLHTPIGIKLGGNSAAEIALAITAEIQSVKFGKKVNIE